MPINKPRAIPNRPRVRRLASGYSFVSYSTGDWVVVSRLVDGLKDVGVWVDKRSVELGDALPEKIESGVANAATFILVLSKASLASQWVKYESHMATIRHLEDANFRILILKIDNCEVPLRFRPFLYADLTKDDNAIDAVIRAASSHTGSDFLFRRHFVNRSDELGKIDLHVADPDKSIVCIHGFYGIGKRALAEESVRRIWQSPKIIAVELSAAYVGARLAAHLSAAAGLPIPSDGAPAKEVRRSSLLAVEVLAEQNRVMIFDHLEHLLDEEGRLRDDISAVLDHIAGFPSSVRVPCYVLSRRTPKFSIPTSLRVGYVRLGGMDIEHVVAILESEASRIERKPIQDSAGLREVAKHLFGYPLAGRLAAPLLVKYSPEYLLKNLGHITKLRRDIAEVILTNTPFSQQQLQLLHTLSICDNALAVADLASITRRDPSEVVNDVDALADYNVLESEGSTISLHPLVSDFYWKQARSGPDFKSLVTQIANYARKIVTTEQATSARFVNWLATACRALFLCDRPGEAIKLRSDFKGELKIAAIELYQRKEYETSLEYCNQYLAYDGSDFEIGLHRARNLSRLGRYDASLKALGELLEDAKSPGRLGRIHFAQARTFLEMRNLGAAREGFLKALQYNHEALPALQGITEVLLKEGKIEDAAGFVERALDVSPMDSFALSMKADILWKRGQRKAAIEIMTNVVKSQPENATFLFRLGRFLQQSGLTADAYDYFHRAKTSDTSYFDARLSLASTAIDLGKLAEAKDEIDSLREKGPADKRHVILGVEAQYYLAVGDIDKAATLASEALSRRRNVIILGIMARVEAAKANRAVQNGMTVVAESHRARALQLLDEGLIEEPENGALLHQRDRLTADRI
jgi:tetratricopeptide (TPR) repeat protein